MITTPAKRGAFQMQGDQWLVFIPQDLKRSEKKSTTIWFLEDWYRTQAEKLIPERIKHYQEILQVEPLKIRIRSFESQWGSCTSRKTLSFHWSLLIAPLEILDYVVVHELSHLVHMDHSRKFWNTVAKALPSYRQRRQWLRTHEASLRLDRIPHFLFPSPSGRGEGEG